MSVPKPKKSWKPKKNQSQAMINKNAKNKKKRSKIILEFDEKARDDFLTGFQKRKTARKLEARDKRDKLVKEERLALRKQIRELKTDKGLKSDAVIPEIEQLVKPKVYDLPDHTVTIADIGDVDFVGKTGLRLGQNKEQDSESEKEEEEEVSDTEDVKAKKKERKEAVATSKSLMKKLASCSNQLSSQTDKCNRNNRRKYIKDKLQAKRAKTKKKHAGKKKRR